MNRRRFLKDAGATAAVVGASALGLEYWFSLASKSLSQASSTSSIYTASSLSTSSSSISSVSTQSSTTSSAPTKMVEISLYYDPHLTGQPTQSTAQLQGLSINGQLTSKISIPSNTTTPLQIVGTSPVGKKLNTATYDEPRKPVSLQTFQYSTGLSDVAIGLADGPATSPIKPSELAMDLFDALQHNPRAFAQYYPQGWPYTPNYFFYGYKIPYVPGQTGGPGITGYPHLAFDIQSPPGTDVHALWGGEIVPGLYDWKFGIANEFGVLYMNHVDPSVSIGQQVSRYDVVATRNKAQSHVHLEYRDLGFNGAYSDFEHSHPERILELFTTMRPEDLLMNPLRGEPVPILPYFGP